MTGQQLRAAAAITLMVAFGVGVYFGLGLLKHTSAIREQAKTPEETRPLITLPGTIIIAQDGALYRLQKGVFTKIASGNWTEPAPTPDHTHLIAVKREANYSDLYLLGLDGTVHKQLTNNASGMVQFNHWSLNPKVAPDGQTVYYDYDDKQCPPQGCYQVDLSIFAMKLAGTQKQARSWTQPHPGTGGDVEPIPLRSGGILYAKYSYDSQTGRIYSQIDLQRIPGGIEHPLTPDNQNCYAPALSSDETQLAMVCTEPNLETTQIIVAPFNGQQLGTWVSVAAGLCNAPTWSPDGSGLLYLGPASSNGFFQLFYLKLAAPATPTPAAGHTAHPSAPAAVTPPPPPRSQQVTRQNNFDATSAPVWL